MDRLDYFNKLYVEKDKKEYEPLYYVLGEYFGEDSILCRQSLKDGTSRFEWIPFKYLIPADNILFARKDEYDSYFTHSSYKEFNDCLESASFWEIHKTINITHE